MIGDSSVSLLTNTHTTAHSFTHSLSLPDTSRDEGDTSGYGRVEEGYLEQKAGDARGGYGATS